MMKERILYAEARCADGRWVRVVREDGSAYVAKVSDLPPGVEIKPYVPEDRAPPDIITARQLRLWLVRHGYTFRQVEDLIATLPEPERTEAQIDWEYATMFSRDNPVLRRLAGALLRVRGDDLEARLSQAFTEASAY